MVELYAILDVVILEIGAQVVGVDVRRYADTPVGMSLLFSVSSMSVEGLTFKETIEILDW